jgi:AhpD family alkylhydroperoxidase
MEEMKEALKEVNSAFKRFGKESPQVMACFGSFMKSVEKEGALSVKTKELIAIAISVCCHCKWCIAFHVKATLDEGATKEEIIEATNVAILMGGAPSLMYGQFVIKALDEFAK